MSELIQKPLPFDRKDLRLSRRYRFLMVIMIMVMMIMTMMMMKMIMKMMRMKMMI